MRTLKRPRPCPASKRPFRPALGRRSNKKNQRPLLYQLLPANVHEQPRNQVAEVLTIESEQQCLELDFILRNKFEDLKRKQITLDQINQDEEYEIILDRSGCETAQVSIWSSIFPWSLRWKARSFYNCSNKFSLSKLSSFSDIVVI